MSGDQLVKTVLVLGATGAQGGAVVGALLAQHQIVRAAVRDLGGASASALARRGARPVQVDFADASSLRVAMRGVDAVFSVQPSSGQPGVGFSDEQEIAAGVAVVESAEREGIAHLVYSSALAAGAGHSGVAHFDTKVLVEERVMASSLGWTILRPATFMEMVVEVPDSGADVVRFLMPADAGVQVVAVADIGRVAAAAVLRPQEWRGRVVDLAGDHVTGHGIAAALARHRGWPVRYEQLDVGAADSLLARLASMIEFGPLGSGADIEKLREEFPALLTFDGWLRHAHPA